MTGRKIIVGAYGSYACHGGDTFSGGDTTKVDCSAPYVARYIAKNIITAGFATRTKVQLAYVVGVTQLALVRVDTFGTNAVTKSRLKAAIREVSDLRPVGTIQMLDLKRPIYR